MVNYEAALDGTFAALADPTRRAILARLSERESSVSELAGPFAMSLPAVMKHVDCLQRAGLIDARKEGRVRRCRLEAAPLAEAAEWITRYRRFWERRFDNLEAYLREPSERKDSSWPARTPPRRLRSAPAAASPPRGKRSSRRGRKPQR
jgi:DNA-binding transcriptional ArsR family regulator